MWNQLQDNYRLLQTTIFRTGSLPEPAAFWALMRARRTALQHAGYISESWTTKKKLHMKLLSG